MVKATDELFQAYVYALSRRTLIESFRQYDFDITTEGDLCVINITCEDMNDIEIEYDSSTGIMAYIIKIDPSDTVG